VSSEACYRSESRFLSCLSAVQRLLEQAPRNLRLVVRGDSSFAGGPPVLVRFGSVAVLEPRARYGREAMTVAMELRASGRRIADWRRLYRSGRGRDIDFSALREWLLSEVVDTDHSAAYAAAAINGYLSIEDAHARIIPTHLIRDDRATGMPGSAKVADESRYSGIGVALEQVGTMPVVTGLIAGSPAALAGLRMNDVLLGIDGESFHGRPIEETLRRLRGPEGTTLELEFRRGTQLHRVRVVRREIALQNVVASVLRDGHWSWGYLRVHSFVPPNTCADARRELDGLIAARLGGLILDLRNNVGGRIDQAVCLADLFLGPGLMVLEMRSTAEQQPGGRKMYTRFGARTELPLVTLVNAGTGSASEILAGALRDYERSLLIGERTFGKGTIQVTRPWDESGSIMQFSTAARFYLPSGNGVQRVGLYPDLDVPQRPGGEPEQQLVLRLEDLYPTTLPADSQAQSRPLQQTQPVLMACLSHEDETVGIGGQLRSEIPDYPVLRATELLHCLP
jgi:carboxyl-terminal processing protease